MRPNVLFALGTMLLLAAYATASLYPFHPLRWGFPRPVANGAELLEQGGIRFPTPGIAHSPGPPEWLAVALHSQRLELSLRLRSFAAGQGGPARILTVSANPTRRNLTLGQEGDDLILRLRTPATDLNGMQPDGTPVARIPDLFATPDWRELAVEIEPGELRVAVDGEIRARTSLPAAPLQGWDPSYPLVLGKS